MSIEQKREAARVFLETYKEYEEAIEHVRVGQARMATLNPTLSKNMFLILGRPQSPTLSSALRLRDIKGIAEAMVNGTD